MYRKTLKEVIRDLKDTNDLIEVSNYLNNNCDRLTFLNIINELLNNLSEEETENKNLVKKIRSLNSDIYQKNNVINKIIKVLDIEERI